MAHAGACQDLLLISINKLSFSVIERPLDCS